MIFFQSIFCILMLQRLARVFKGAAGRSLSRGLSHHQPQISRLETKSTICNMSSKSKPLPSALPMEVFSLIHIEVFVNIKQRTGWSGSTVRWLVLTSTLMLCWRSPCLLLRCLLSTNSPKYLQVKTLHSGWYAWNSGCNRVNHHLHPSRCAGQYELLVLPPLVGLEWFSWKFYLRCVKQHGESGLTKACLESQISMKEAEDMVMKVKRGQPLDCLSRHLWKVWSRWLSRSPSKGKARLLETQSAWTGLINLQKWSFLT